MSKPLLAAALAAFIAGFAIAACGEDEEAAAQETDGAFIAEMVPHHEAAIEMAEMAQEEAKHAEIRALADEIVAAQEAEIGQLEAAHERIFGEPLAGADHGTLGLDEHMAGMSADMSQLRMAGQFDQMFIDMMIPHHQGAIRMARIELDQGEDGELQEIAQAIIEAQSREIEEMNSWREEWYGAPSPAGGVPPEDEEGSMPSHEEMGH